MKDRLHSNMLRAAVFGTAGAFERSARTFGWQPVSLDPDALEAAARRAMRLEDFGDPYYREGLGRLVQSIEQDADLHLIGRVFMRQYIRNALINRLLLQEHRRARPDIHQAPLRPPIIITGLPRTGSTWLHQVMSRVPGFFAPPYWLLVRPLPASPRDTEDARRSAAQREIRVWKSITPSLRDKHKVSVNAPEECVFALSLTFQTQIFMVPAESYLAWYASSERQGKYADYRSILMVLQAMHPDKTLLLKAPDHLGGLDALCAAVPEARIVQLHRDPVKIMSSVASLAYSAQYGLTNRRDPARVAASLADYFETTLRRNLAHRPHLPVPVLDFHYDEVVADPVGTVAQILSSFHQPLAPRERAKLAGYVKRKTKDRRPHKYSSAEFGLDDAQTAERFSFYSTCFEARRGERAPVNPSLP